MSGLFFYPKGRIMDCKEMILSDDFYNILLDYPAALAEEGLEGIPNCFQQLENGYSVLYVDSRETEPLNLMRYRYAYIPKCYGLLSPGKLGSAQVREAGGAYVESGITSVQRPPLSLSGEGILIGFIDTGVRYRLDEFIGEDGESKIFSVWDQTLQDGNPPEGFAYGTEITREMIGRELARIRRGEEETIGHRDESGHGSQMVSAALRAAPGAQIVMVKCRQVKPYLKRFYGIAQETLAYGEDDIMTGLTYLERIANQQNKPLVICITMGTNMGDHRGNSLLNRYMELLGNRRRRSIVIGGGNEGNLGHHYKGSVEIGDSFAYEDVEIRVGENVRSFSFELWGNIPYNFSIALRAPDGELADRIPIRYGQERTVRFVFSGTSVYVSYVFVERNTGAQLIFVRFTDPSPGIWTVRVYAEGESGKAEYNMWLPMEAFLEEPTYFLRPDPYLTMTEPSYFSDGIGNTYYDWEDGSFALGSGRGDEVRRESGPALSVAGVNVATAFGEVTGSGVSAALMAGAVALFMEWAIIRQGDPLLGSVEIRNYFIRGAQRSVDENYPNPLWGYGKMNIEGVFRELIEEI